MTTFTGPLNVKPLDSETTVASVDTSGNQTLNGNLTVNGNITSGTSDAGSVVLAQRTTVLAQNSATNPAQIVLPSGSDTIDYFVDVEIPFAAGALVTAQRVNIRTGATANVIAEIGVSASGRYDALGATGANHSLIRNVTATIAAFVSTKALASAATAGQAMLTVTYVQN